MKKGKILLIAFIIFILCFITIYLIKWFDMKMIPQDEHLKDKIYEKIATSKEINFSDITEFEWDEMYTFGPYSIPKEKLKDKNINWRRMYTSVDTNETCTLIIFLYRGDLVSYLDYSKINADFDSEAIQRFDRESANFKIKKDKLNKIILIPK